jgi:hypothetical protein
MPHPVTQPSPAIETADLPTQIRAAQIQPATFDEAARTVEVVFTTGARVRRYDYRRDRLYDEELEVSESAVNMSRMAAGASVLDTHGQYQLRDVIGVVERAWIAGTEGRAMVRLSERPELAGIVADIRSGVIRHISAGYTVERMEMTPPEQRTDGGAGWLYRAVSWTPAEISFVPVPADAGSGTRSQPSTGATPCEFVTRAAAQTTPKETMPQANEQGGTPTTAAVTPATETRAAAPEAAAAPAVDLQARAADISELCARHGVPALAAGLIRSGSDVSAARSAVLDELARVDAAAGGHRNAAPRIETVRDQHTTRMAGIEQAMMHRISPSAQLDDNGRQYRGMSLLEIGREMLEGSSVNTRGMARNEIASGMIQVRSGGMHTTSDFASLLGSVANRRLRAAYEESASTYQAWARRAPNAPDTRNINVVQLSGAPDLMQVNEAGEYTYGTLIDGAVSYKVVKYGRIVSVTEEAIINDDLRGFDRLLSAFGFSASRLENRLAYAQLVGADYSAPNGNLQTGAPSQLQASSLAAARASMRKQKGLGNELLNLAPAYLIVPVSLEQTAYQLTSTNYVPATASAINEFRAGGRTAVEPIVEPILDETSATAWYAAAASGAVDTIEYCYLDGAEGPTVTSKSGWEVDGVDIKCKLWFAAKAVDFRGLHKANGA